MKIRQYIFTAMLQALCLTFVSCRSGNDKSEEPLEDQATESIIENLTITPSNVSVSLGTSLAFRAESKPDSSDAVDVTQRVIWSLDPSSDALVQNDKVSNIYVAEEVGETFVYAISSDGKLAKAKVSVFEEVTPSPVANPTSVSASSNSVSDIQIDWTPAVGIVHHQISYLEGSLAPANCNVGFVISEDVVGLANSYVMNALQVQTTYSFRVCSVDTEGNLSSGITITQSTSGYHRVFVTSGGWNGSTIGGLDGADEKCNLEAGLVGLEGTWKAVLSGSAVGESALARIFINRAIYNMRADGLGGPQFIAMNASDLWDGLIANPVIYQADGSAAALTLTWTGSSTNGTYSGANCTDWSSTAGTGGRALNSSATATWVTNSTSTCSTIGRLYCIDGQQ